MNGNNTESNSPVILIIDNTKTDDNTSFPLDVNCDSD